MEWIATENESGSQICVNAGQLSAFGLSTDFISRLHKSQDGRCLDLSAVPELGFSLNKGTMVLSVTVPGMDEISGEELDAAGILG